MTRTLSLPNSELPAPTGSGQQAPATAGRLSSALDRWLAQRVDGLVAIRRHLHTHPDLSQQEPQTAELIARELAAAGLQPRMALAGKGVICDIGQGDRVVALQTMLPGPATSAALRSDEACPSPACGNDLLVATLLGAGLALASLHAQAALRGRVRLIFQPAKQAEPDGAPQVIADGGLKEVSAILGLSCAARLLIGEVGLRSGPICAATDEVEVTLSGSGGHTARPHLTADIAFALGRVIVGLPPLLSRRVRAQDAVSLSWDCAQAGEAYNAIPRLGSVRGRVQTMGTVWRQLPELVSELATEVAAGTGAQVAIQYEQGTPPVVNDKRLTQLCAAAAISSFGPYHVVDPVDHGGDEGFGWYLDQVPGVMLQVGVGPKGPLEPEVGAVGRGWEPSDMVMMRGLRLLVEAAAGAMDAPLS